MSFNDLNRRLFTILFHLVLYLSTIQAEDFNGIIKGKVFDDKNIPLYGAHIALPSLSRGTVTNENGEFLISNLPNTQIRVVISYVGYESQSITVDLRENNVVDLTIHLKPTAISTEPVVVTGNPYAVNPLDSPQDINTLSGREKLAAESASLGKTLENLPGVYNLSAGSVAGKPVVRGFTGERVLILSDGVAQEYQQYGERHTPTIDVFNYDRVEVIKGAASLLYGSDAMGGAINLIPHPFHFSEDERIKLGGSVNTGYFSNNNEYMAGAKINSSTKLFSFYGNIIRRKADNFHTPNVAPYSVTQTIGDPKFTGEIPHTNFEQVNGSVGVGYLSPFGIMSIEYDHFLNENNFLLPTGLPIGVRLENQVLNVKANLPFNNFIIKPKFSYQKNQRLATRDELNYTSLPDSADVDLILDVYTGRVEVENLNIFNLTGTIGAEIKYYDHNNVGKVPLQPTGNFTNYALFIFEEWKKNKLTLNIGGRVDYRDQIFYGTTNNPLLPKDDKRQYSSISGAFGAAYKLTDHFTVTGNINRGFRTPSFFNLYVYGYHGGVFAFQIGNPNLKNETSLDISTSLRFHNEFFNSHLTVFNNLIYNYIYLYNAPDHPLAPTPKPEFIFAQDQADARMTGVEVSVETYPFEWLQLSGSYSKIRSEFLNGPWSNGELPLMPPDKLIFNAKFLLPNISIIKSPYFLVNGKFVSSKKAAGIYEPFGQFDNGIGPDIPFGVCSTDKYNLLELGLGFNLCLYKQPISVDISVTNVTNEVYRDFLDTYKGYALSPGRSFNIRVNVPF